MSHLLSKSGLNYKSAEFLHSKNLYCSSVHCSYYSCVQLMLHILRSDLGKTDSDIDEESRQGAKDEEGFHNWLRNTILRQFFLKNAEAGREFNNFIGTLAGFRVKADYKNYEVKETVAKQSIDYAKVANELLESNFKI